MYKFDIDEIAYFVLIKLIIIWDLFVDIPLVK